jgi:DNA/RNA endonuclease G (NUC1)
MRRLLVLVGLGLAQANTIVRAESDIFEKIAPSRDRYRIKKSKDLLICYDSRSRNPIFVVEHLRSAKLLTEHLKRPNFFAEILIDDDFKVKFFLFWDLTPEGWGRRFQRFRL